MPPGTFHVVGVGPGDPELLTLKAARVIAAAPVVAHFAKRGSIGLARAIAAAHVAAAAEELRFEYPFTTEIPVRDPRYAGRINIFYEACAGEIAGRLDRGQDVALLCEGDPFFYGSSMYLFDRLGAAYRSEIVPGLTGMAGCWARAKLPITQGDDVLTVLPGTLDEAGLVDRLTHCDAAVIMKLGRNMPKVLAALARTGLLERAVYVERGTMQDERILPVAAMSGQVAPYFSLVLVPGRRRAR